MLITFPGIQFGLMVGIAGGALSYKDDIRLGDVVVSRHLIQYDFGRTFRQGRFQRIGALNKPPSLLLTALDGVRSGEKTLGRLVSNALQNIPNIEARFSKPSEDWLFQATYNHQGDTDCSACDKSQLLRRGSRATNDPQVHYGLIASGNQIIRDDQTRDRLAQELYILCFDMEAAEVVDSFPFLVIRGICDYSDSHRNQRGRGYAALTAAAYSKLVLSEVPVSSVQTSETNIKGESGK